MLHFHYLVWLKKITSLSNFPQKVYGNSNNLDQLLYFLDYIITISLLIYPLIFLWYKTQVKTNLLFCRLSRIQILFLQYWLQIQIKLLAKFRYIFFYITRYVTNMAKAVLDTVSIFLDYLLRKYIQINITISIFNKTISRSISIIQQQLYCFCQ